MKDEEIEVLRLKYKNKKLSKKQIKENFMFHSDLEKQQIDKLVLENDERKPHKYDDDPIDLFYEKENFYG